MRPIWQPMHVSASNLQEIPGESEKSIVACLSSEAHNSDAMPFLLTHL